MQIIEPPHMTVKISERGINICITIHKAGSGFCALRGAYSLQACGIFISRAHRYKLSAGKPSVVELVDHQTLESIGDWIDVVDPAQPRVHVSNRQGKPCVDH
jgi:hypothetical protein